MSSGSPGASSSGVPGNKEAPVDEHWDRGKAYLDLIDDLDEFLDSAKVPDYMIYQDLDEDCKIIVTGPNISQLQNKLQDVKNKKANFNKFTLVATDFTPKHPSAPNMWINQYQPVRCSWSVESNPSLSFIELMLQSRDKKYFAVTTAHSFLTEDQQSMLRNDDSFSNVRLVWEELEREYAESRKRYVMATDDEQIKAVDMVSHPHVFYRDCYHLSDKLSPLADIVVCELNEEKLQEGGWLSEKIHCSHEGKNTWDSCTVKEIRTRVDLKDLENRAIVCKQKRGKILLPPALKRGGGVIGLHLSFIFDEGVELEEGDCGSLVYLETDETDQQNCIAGMFIGTSVVDPRIHQAVILSKNLQKVGESGPFQGVELQVYQPANRLLARNGFYAANFSKDKGDD